MRDASSPVADASQGRQPVLHGVARIVVDLDAAWGALAEWGASAANDTRTLEVSNAMPLSSWMLR